MSYRSFVAAQSQKRSRLQDLSEFLSEDTAHQRACRIDCVEFSKTSTSPDLQSLNLGQLASLFHGTPHEKTLRGRLLIIEDLSYDLVEMLGSALNINPLFFASHIDTSHVDIRKTRASMANLPSIIRSQNFLNLHYQRVLEFDDKVPKKGLLRDMNLERKVKILLPIKGKSFALARHCCSILHTVGKDGLWLGLMLVDPPINNAYKYLNPNNQKAETISLQTRPFHDGDDYGSPSFLEMVPNLSPMQTSLSETLTAHWTQRLPQDCDLTSPSLFALAYCPLRIVAMEWMTYSELMYHSIKHYEYSTETIPAALERIEVLSADLSALQQWIRRGMATSEKIRQVIHFLRSVGTSSKDVDQGTLLLEDYEQLACTIESYSRRLEAMVAIAASVIQAIDCRRSFTETANISRLTYLALGFIPLTFASSLFSMNEKIAPGGKTFWLYFAVAIPLCFLVFIIVRSPAIFFGINTVCNWRSSARRKHMV